MLNFEWLTSEFLCTVCDIISSPRKIKKYSSKKSRNLQSSSITEIESTVKGMYFFAIVVEFVRTGGHFFG